MNPMERISYYEKSFTKSEHQLFQLLSNQPSIVIRLGIDEVAKQGKVSKAAVTRFCQKIGYSGFTEFKFEMSRYIIGGKYQKGDQQEGLSLVLNKYAEYIKKMESFLDPDEIKSMAMRILRSKRIKLMGENRSYLSASQLRLRLSKIGLDAEATADRVLMAALQDVLATEDLVIIFSITANDNLYLKYIKEYKTHNSQVCLVTMTPNSKMEKYCDQVILLPYISHDSNTSFLDDQAIFFVFIEVLLATVASLD